MTVEARNTERDACLIEAAIKLQAQADLIDCVIENISEHGARVRLVADKQKLPDTFALMLPLVAEHREKRLVELRWQIGSTAGVRFLSDT